MTSYSIQSLLAARQFVSPQRVGDRLYFISDLSGCLSLYSMRVGGSVPEEHGAFLFDGDFSFANLSD